MRTVRASFAKSKVTFPSTTAVCRPRLMEPRLQTAVSSSEVTSRISVQRFDRWTVRPGVRGLVAGAVRPVLEGHPAVAGLGQRPHHPRVELARLDRLRGQPALLRRRVGLLERLAEQIRQRRDDLGIEQAPVAVGLHPSHEQIGDPVGQVQVVGAARLVAGVVAQREELLDVRVPGLEVDAAGPLALAPLIDRRHRGVQRLQPGDDPVRLSVGPLDQRSARAHAVIREADAARELGEQRHVGVAVVDRLQVIGGRVEQEAARELLVARPRVEHRRRARQVLQRREQLIELQRLAHRLRQRAGDPQEKLLRRLQHQPRLRVLQQIAIVERAQPEVLELAIALGDQGVVQLAGVLRDEAPPAGR